MAEQINITQEQEPPPRPTTVVTEREGPGPWVVVGALIGAVVVLLLLWAFWLQPSFFPQVQVLSLPQPTAPTVIAPPASAPAPDVNVQGGTGGAGGTGGTGTGGTGGTGTGGTGTNAPSSTTTP